MLPVPITSPSYPKGAPDWDQTSEPRASTAHAAISIIGCVSRGESDVDLAVAERFHGRLEDLSSTNTAVHRTHFDSKGLEDFGPLDPFMSLADRPLMPVAVRDRHVEVSLHDFANYLQSPNSTLRVNLHNAIISAAQQRLCLAQSPARDAR